MEKHPTIPFWFGDRASRTYDLGKLVGQFRKEIAERTQATRFRRLSAYCWTITTVNRFWMMWSNGLKQTYHVNRKGALAITEYLREQQFITGSHPIGYRIFSSNVLRMNLGSSKLSFTAHLASASMIHGQWCCARSMEQIYGFRPVSATVDDGILLSIPAEAEIDFISDIGRAPESG